MATQIPSTFTRYNLQPEEIAAGAQLTNSTQYLIQNLICDAAEERLNLRFDPLNPLAFAQREAELQGQINILKYLVELSVTLPLPTLSTQD